MPILDRISVGEKSIIIFEGDPVAEGVDAELGSLIILNNGTAMYQKTNTGASNWSKNITEYTFSDISSVGTITTGTWNGSTIDIAYGGTGATTASAALNNLLPSQTGNNGKVLSTDGTTVFWGIGGGGTTISGLTENYLTKSNATGDNIVNSIIYDNGINIGIGNNNPLYKLDVSGTGRFVGSTAGLGTMYMAFEKTDNIYTDSGLIFSNSINNIHSGLITEADGEILSFGINVSQINSTNEDLLKYGGIFRFDTRAGQPYFSIIRRDLTNNFIFDFQIDTNGNVIIPANINGLNISSGEITNATWYGNTISILYGGTGATTASEAINNLLPSQTGNNGKVLSTDGTNVSWATVNSGASSLADTLAIGNNTGSYNIITGNDTNIQSFDGLKYIQLGGSSLLIDGLYITSDSKIFLSASTGVNLGTSVLELPSLTTDTVVYINGSNQLVSSSITSTKLSYLTDVTSNIQSQLNNKLETSATTTDLTEGTNLYYTQSRFDTAFGSKSTTDLTEGTNLYYTNSRTINSTLTGYISNSGIITESDSILSAIQKLNGNISSLITGVSSVNGLTGSVNLTTSNIGEGTNLYYTQSRFDTAFGSKSTTDLTEGTNLYYTDVRVRNVIDAITGDVTFNAGISSISNLTVTNAMLAGSIASNKLIGTDIATVGTITSGVWNGTAISDTYISSSTNWNTAFNERRQWDGGSTNLVAATGRTSLGATTLGSNLFTATNPNAISFIRANADNSVSLLDATTFRTSIGAGTGNGTVTSITFSTGTTGLTGGSTITTSGTWTLAGTLVAVNGGTGQSSFLVGDLLYADTTTTLAKLNAVATGNALISGGIGAPFSWGKIGLTTHVSGTLPIANGGTGQTTANAALNALLPSQTGNTGKYLLTDGTNTSWNTIVGVSTNATPSQTQPADPATTTSTTGVMMGLARSFTPNGTGNILIVISGDVDNATQNANGSQIQIRTGTGTAPTNGAALTGTTRGSLIKYLNTSGNNGAGRVPFSLNAVVTGLTPGTAYWIDISLASITGGTSRVRDLSVSIIEV